MKELKETADCEKKKAEKLAKEGKEKDGRIKELEKLLAEAVGKVRIKNTLVLIQIFIFLEIQRAYEKSLKSRERGRGKG